MLGQHLIMRQGVLEEGIKRILLHWESKPLPSLEILEGLYETLGAAQILAWEDGRFKRVAEELESIVQWYNGLVYGSVLLPSSKNEGDEKLGELSTILANSRQIVVDKRASAPL